MKHGLIWYWHRLRAMRPEEARERFRQKLRQRQDTRRLPDFKSVQVGRAASGAWPCLPARDAAPREVRERVRLAAAEVLAGRWRAFGHLAVTLDDPPRWFMDYAAGREIPTGRSAFRLNHRELPRGCDIKMIWELSRWHLPVRLAQAAWLLEDRASSDRCMTWLEDWVRRNPPYYGWNWTSALETGIRLLNFVWIDALLEEAGVDPERWARIRQAVLPAHVWHASRHGSVGSSANNHLLGELAGLIVAVLRWPRLERWSGSIDTLHARWEREVLAQFAEDGGNREQALNYHLFSFELCWLTRLALRAAERPVSDGVEARLRAAADFHITVQVPDEAWDYGDSDSATAVPLYGDETRAAAEWYAWLGEPGSSPSLRWWLGEPPPPMEKPTCVRPSGDWLVFPESGQAVCWSGEWQARWDLSPLGFLSTAAHGHLDALHLSLWLRGVALVIDPGTGAYYGDTRLRAWLASWAAHNGPHLPGADSPRRLGPFLWEQHHARPRWRALPDEMLEGQLELPHGTAIRRIRRLTAAGNGGERDGWQVDDRFIVSPRAKCAGVRVCWHFAPGTLLENRADNPHLFRGMRKGVDFTVGFDGAWSEVRLFPETTSSIGFPVAGDLTGLCSQAFRRIEAGPVIMLTARRDNPAMYRTTFLAGTGAWLRKD